MKRGLQVKLGPQEKVTFKDNSKGVLELLNTLLTLYHHHSVFLGQIFVVFSDKLGIWKILEISFFNV
jgi:hypothetical protein